MDTMSDRMEIDHKLRKKKLLPGPSDYQDLEKIS